ncbi:MAG TPA: protein-L-isoaspartate O-methyltransferase [Thiotrichales bacterium]|nr:protein-L-isoaspartate O-methyltransferase [Thiotrichales bacterium]
MDFEKARFNMVEQQIRPWDVLNDDVLAVLGEIPRENFTPEQYKNIAYSDTRIPVGTFEDQPIRMMQPNIDGRILQSMAINKDDLVLEIGTGTGYLTACLAKLARHVDSVDINPELTAQAEKNLDALGITNVNLSTGDAAKGWRQKAYYDVIIINGSLPAVPASYKKMLTTGGRLFVVTGEAPVMTAYKVTRTGKDKWTVEALFETCIDPLIHAKKAESFSF